MSEYDDEEPFSMWQKADKYVPVASEDDKELLYGIDEAGGALPLSVGDTISWGGADKGKVVKWNKHGVITVDWGEPLGKSDYTQDALLRQIRMGAIKVFPLTPEIEAMHTMGGYDEALIRRFEEAGGAAAAALPLSVGDTIVWGDANKGKIVKWRNKVITVDWGESLGKTTHTQDALLYHIRRGNIKVFPLTPEIETMHTISGYDEAAPFIAIGRLLEEARDDKFWDSLVEQKTAKDYLPNFSLYQQHPWLKNIPVDINPEHMGMGEWQDEGPGEGRIVLAHPSYLRVLKHELAHALQSKEGREKGGSSLTQWTGKYRAGTLALAKQIFKEISTPISLERYTKEAGFDSEAEAKPSYQNEYLKQFKDKKWKDNAWLLAQKAAGERRYRELASEKEAGTWSEME